MRRDPAARRYGAMQTVRAAGALLALAGALIVNHRLAFAARVPDTAGLALMTLGIAAFFIAPVLLARRWKSGR